MCLFVTIEAIDRKRLRCTAEDLAAASGLHVEQTQKATFRLFLPGDCGCGFGVGDLVSDQWKWSAEAKAPLEAVLAAATKRLKRFRFKASWLGEARNTEVQITLDNLISALRAGTFDPALSYVVCAF